MIINYKDLKNKMNFLKCSKFLANYFIYECHLPVFSRDNEQYLFVYNKALQNAVKQMPLQYRIILSAEGFWNEIKDML
jgi:hypothetical protein